jgi:hypothetical protein
VEVGKVEKLNELKRGSGEGLKGCSGGENDAGVGREIIFKIRPYDD